MAISQERWDKAKEYFEAGLSLSEIVLRTEISKAQISKKSKIENWEKGTKSIIIKETIIVPKGGIVYFIQAGETNYYKIGVTCEDIQYRLKQLQTGNHLPLKIVRVFYSDNVYKLEKDLHLEYNVFKTIGEWFSLPLEVVEQIKNRLING